MPSENNRSVRRTAAEAYLRGELHSDASACHKHEHAHECHDEK